VLWTKNIAFMRYVYFIEGLVFVALALMTAQAGGMLAIIVCSLICSCLFSGVYGVWRISDYFQVPWQEVIFRWSGLMLKTILFYIPMAGIVWLGGQLIPAPALRLAISAVAFGSMGTFIFLRYGLPRNFQHEISQRAPRITLPILKRILIAR
jgi:hypothetical protein